MTLVPLVLCPRGQAANAYRANAFAARAPERLARSQRTWQLYLFGRRSARLPDIHTQHFRPQSTFTLPW